MAKKEYCCLECDMHFTISFKGTESVKVCPFCGADFEQDDANDYEDDME
jgi:rubrerythrin